MPYKDPEQMKEKRKEIYYYNKEHNICVRCGKRQAMENHTCCLECNEKAKNRQKKTYYWLKQHHICAACGKNPAERNHIYCYECNMKLHEVNCKRFGNMTDDQKRAKNKYLRNWINKRKENGVCVECGKSNNNGKAKCNECLLRQRRYQKERRRIKGAIPTYLRGNGEYCYLCCKPVETKGEKLCESCKKKATENINKGRLQYLEHHENPFKLLKPFGGKRK